VSKKMTCAICDERPAQTKGRCRRCYSYYWFYNRERPRTTDVHAARLRNIVKARAVRMARYEVIDFPTPRWQFTLFGRTITVA
jgi:predicted ATP-dependent serine protease